MSYTTWTTVKLTLICTEIQNFDDVMHYPLFLLYIIPFREVVIGAVSRKHYGGPLKRPISDCYDRSVSVKFPLAFRSLFDPILPATQVSTVVLSILKKYKKTHDARKDCS